MPPTSPTAPRPSDGARRSEAGPRRDRRWTLAIALACGAVALTLRAIVADRAPFGSDEAVQGLLALRLLDGRLPGVTWPGQSYAGTLEVPLQAALQALDRGDVLLLRLPLALVSSVAVALFSVLVQRLTRSHLAAAAAGATAAVASTGFVQLGSWMPSGYNLSLLLLVAAAVVLVREGPRSTARIVAAGALLVLSVYEQPLSLLLAVPLALLVDRAGFPFARREATALSALLGVQLLALVVYDAVGSRRQLFFGRLDADLYPLTDRLRAVLGVEHPGVAHDTSGPMPWVVAGLGGFSSHAASVLSIAMWLALLAVVLRALPIRRVRPGRGSLFAAWAASSLVAGLLALLASFLVYPPGRLGYAACLLLPLGVAAVFTVPAVRRRPWLAGGALAVVLVLHTARLVHDLPPRPDHGPDRAYAAALAARGRPAVGGYFDVYRLAFLARDRLQVVSLSANRFPGLVYALPAGASLDASWLVVAVDRRDLAVKADDLRGLGCSVSRVRVVEVVEGGLLATADLRCPRATLLAGTPRAT